MSKKWKFPAVKEGTIEIRYKAKQSGNPPPAEDFSSFSQRVQQLRGDFCRLNPETGHQAFFYCLRCRCSCSSPANLQDHLLGEKHNKELTRKQLRKLEERLAQESNEREERLAQESNESGVPECEIDEEADAENTVDPFDAITDHLGHLCVENVTDRKRGHGECDQDWPKMRHKERVFLEALLCQSDLPEFILVHGQHDVAKTSVLRKVLEASLHPHTFVTSVYEEAYGPGALFQFCLEDLSRSLGTSEDYRRSSQKSDFVDNLKTLVGSRTAVIVIETKVYISTKKLMKQISLCLWSKDFGPSQGFG